MHAKGLKILAACLIASTGLAVVQVDAHRGSGSPDWELGHPRALTAFENPANPPGGGLCAAQYPCSPAVGTNGQPAAVFYPNPSGTGITGGLNIPAGSLSAANDAFSPLCTSSPSCIPSQVPLNQASPWFGTPRPSGSGCGGSTGPCGGPPNANPPGPPSRTIPNGYFVPGPARLPNPCMPSPSEDIVFVNQAPYYTDPSEYPVIAAGEWSPVESLTNLATSPPTYVARDSVANTPYNGALATKFHNQYSNPPATAFGDGRFHLTNESVAQSAFDVTNQQNSLFFANGDPKDVEGAPDSLFVQMGNDGYILGRFEQPVVDQDGYDFQVNLVQPSSNRAGTICVYGATSPTGPFTLVHSGFDDDAACDRTPANPPSGNPMRGLATSAYCPALVNGQQTSPCPNLEVCLSFDLSFFYTPLRILKGEAEPGRLDYFLVANSFQHTPYLKNDFTVERITADPMTPPGLAPLRSEARYFFNDTSVRFGYPLWYILDTGLTGSPVCYSSCYADPFNVLSDPIVEWNWDFTSDPYSLSHPPANRPPVDPANPTILLNWDPADRDRRAWRQDFDPRDHDEEHVFVSPGIFQACHSVHTTDQILPTQPLPTLAVWRQSDPPMSDPDPSGNNPGPAGFAPPPGHFPSPLNPKLPKTKDMHCQPVPVYNIPPTPLFAYGATWNDPLTIEFYDLTEDTDWTMPPAADFGPCVRAGSAGSSNRCNSPPSGGAYDGCCACPDCPPDGVQLRTWDFTSDGVVDYSWRYASKSKTDGRFCTSYVLQPAAPPFPCPQNPATGLPGATDSGDPFLLRSQTFNFQPGDCHATPGGSQGAWIYGPGIRNGTTIVDVLSPQVVRLSQSVYADVLISGALGSPFVVACPYASEFDDPQYTYPRPGQYNATLFACDHDYNITLTARTYGARAWPAPAPAATAGRQWALQGDPYGAATGVAPSPSPFLQLDGTPVAPGIELDSSLPARFLNLHACQALRQPVRIPNHQPQLTIPPTLVVRPNTVVTFTVRGSDADRGQGLTLRPCPGLPLLPGMEFADVFSPSGKAVERTVTFNVGPLSIGHYGPFCYEVTDGIAVTHAVMHLWVSGETTDTDADGIRDLADNCPGIPNHDQLDANGDGVGDACQETAVSFEVTPPQLQTFDTLDHDGDGIADLSDNCVSLANREQADVDHDLVGDVCDLDADGDGIVNTNDNCPTFPNPLQEDSNKDGVGDICARLGLGGAAADPVKADKAEPPTVDSGTLGLVVGSALGMLAMVAILVPVLVFALRRNRGGGRGGHDGER